MFLEGKAFKIFKEIIKGVNEENPGKKIDNNSAFMPVHVELVNTIDLGTKRCKMFSIAHYFEQNGDLVPDPEMVFLQYPNGNTLPMSIQHPFKMPTVVVKVIPETGLSFDTTNQEELLVFTKMWMKNISNQQGIKIKETKMNVTIEKMQQAGWAILKDAPKKINGRIYSGTIMQKDNVLIRVNHQGTIDR
jgi:hypothetical protein